ncbi:sensor histidine kinase [Geobacter grbiciae]|uniref:sensor histidine kinase n=1 Tax=Geobacter grbiciae TaxID=155042 RepID=UPI001C022275|nr:ATP-binding protein [Geobacter grbiciae]MBT1073669.1 PAS domain S-box protein [Geobacter grbiciae]
MSSPNHRICLVVGWVGAVLLFLGLVGTFVAYRIHNASIFGVLPHVLVFLMLCFIFMAVSYRRMKSEEALAHVKELMQVQRELDKTARRYRSLMEGAGTAIFVFNADTGMLVEVNRRGTELFGYDKEEMIPLRGKDLVLEEDQEKFISLVHRVARRGRGRSDGITFRRKGGECFLGQVDARLIDLGDEKVVHAVVRDITFRHRAEREVRQRNRELSTLVGIITRANQETELETVLAVTLRETIEAFGANGGGIHLSNQDGKLRPTASINVPEQLRFLLARRDEAGPLERIAGSGTSLSLANLEAECRFGSSPAVQGWKGFVGVPLSARNRVTGVMYLLCRKERRFGDDEVALLLSIAGQVGIVIDNARLFDELKWKSDELMGSLRLLERSSHELSFSQHRLRTNLMLVERANQELERIDRMKSNFLGMISHEFRTPLTSIISGTEFLLSSPSFQIGSDARRVLDMINQGGERLSEIVSDILKVAKLEANSTAVSRSTLHISQVFEEVLETLEPLRAERDLTISFDDLERLPHCSGDRECFRDIFTELLENSIKFTPDGGTIMVAARVVDMDRLSPREEILSRFNARFLAQAGDNCYLEVEVRDSGIGVSHDEQVKIFDKFYEVGDIRHHSSGKNKFQGKGTGLGLAIVKGMVEAHGGMVWVESPGESSDGRLGSAFFVLLPLEESACQPQLPLSGVGMSRSHDDLPDEGGG